MPWFNRTPVAPRHLIVDWTERVREVHPEEDGSSRISYRNKSCKEICKEQLDPRYVTIERLIAEGVTIDAGYVRSLFNFTDPAEIEELNNDATRSMYNYCMEHKAELFPVVEESKVE